MHYVIPAGPMSTSYYICIINHRCVNAAVVSRARGNYQVAVKEEQSGLLKVLTWTNQCLHRPPANTTISYVTSQQYCACVSTDLGVT